MSIQSVFNAQALEFAKPTLEHFAGLAAADRARVADFCLTAIGNTHKPVADMDAAELAKFNANLRNRVQAKIEAEGVDKYHFTVGLQTTSEGMVKVAFERYENAVKAFVLNANTGSIKTKLGVKWISREALQSMPEDQADNIVFARAAFKMFGLDI